MAFSVFANILKWGNGFLSPATNTSPAGDAYAPAMRAMHRKNTFTIFDSRQTPMPATSAFNFTSAWYDSQVSGTNFVSLNLYANGGSTTALSVQGCDDFAVAASYTQIATNGGATGSGNTPLNFMVNRRYWRVLWQNSAASIVILTATEMSIAPYTNLVGQTGVSVGMSSSGSGLSISNFGSIAADGQSSAMLPANGGGNNALAVGIGYINGPSGTGTFAGVRTPAVFRGSQFNSAGQNIIWSPQTAKKFRLMKYKIEVGEDATIASGPLPVNLAFTQVLPSNVATGATIAGFNLPQFTHRFVAPNAVLATSGNLYDSGLVNLGNGAVGTAASYPLAMGIMVPQTTGAVNPSWTIASNQWEAATVGFKTNGNLGNFKLVQSATVVGVASVASIALPATAFTQGNSIFVFIRYSKVVGGAATITVTDTAGNTYTVSAQTANATDGANGSAIAVAYCINVPASASLSANTITVNYGTNNAAASSVLMLEYAGLGSGGIDAALVGTSGNSTTPASGNYTPATAGDLLFSFFGTSATLASLPTVGSNFRLINGTFAATSGALGVADNFGNGALALGQVNVIAMGTEE